MEKFFYMPLEIKNRDFYSRLLISLELCGKHNFDIFFGYRGDVNYLLKIIIQVYTMVLQP